MTAPNKRTRPAWQLPVGVSRGTWDYLHSPSIAQDYDQYFQDHPLLQLDIEIVRRFLPPDDAGQLNSRPVVADFGCGTARVSRALSPSYRMLNIDLSRHMLLEAVAANAKQTAAAVASTQREHATRNSCVQANLVQLEWLRDRSLSAAVCLFSSIGMIRGRANRCKFLEQVHRSLQPTAPFILHVHNRLSSLFDPGGPAWLLQTLVRSWLSRDSEFGDRVYAYRGLPAMYLHIYSRRELISDLHAAGFRDIQILPINHTSSALLPAQVCCASLRAGGFFAVARRGP